MKKLFSYIGFATLISLSIIISRQTTTVVKNIDTLMAEIKNNAKNYEKQPIDAKITENTMIPGLKGQRINIEKTYEQMKKIRRFNEKYIVYEEIEPNISIKSNLDKYIISGNKTKNTISLIIEIKTPTEQNTLNEMIEIAKKNNTPITIYINPQITKENIKIEDKHENIQIINSQSKYCIQDQTSKKDETKLNNCTEQRKYTVIPNIEIKKSLLKETKRQITAGSIIRIPINDSTKKELELTIKYIKTKGYTIETLDKHLSENN